MCICTCLGREAKVKVDVTDRCTGSCRETGVVAQGTMRPRASAHDEAAMITGLQAGEDASLMLGMATAGADRSFGWLWVDLYWLDILGGPTSPRG